MLFNFYMQHALLETDAHYVDFPWRPTNCIQDTAMPDRSPAAEVFYDVTDPTRRSRHELYIRKCLDELCRLSALSLRDNMSNCPGKWSDNVI